MPHIVFKNGAQLVSFQTRRGEPPSSSQQDHHMHLEAPPGIPHMGNITTTCTQTWGTAPPPHAPSDIPEARATPPPTPQQPHSIRILAARPIVLSHPRAHWVSGDRPLRCIRVSRRETSPSPEPRGPFRRGGVRLICQQKGLIMLFVDNGLDGERGYTDHGQPGRGPPGEGRGDVRVGARGACGRAGLAGSGGSCGSCWRARGGRQGGSVSSGSGVSGVSGRWHNGGPWCRVSGGRGAGRSCLAGSHGGRCDGVGRQRGGTVGYCGEPRGGRGAGVGCGGRVNRAGRTGRAGGARGGRGPGSRAGEGRAGWDGKGPTGGSKVGAGVGRRAGES